MVNKDSDELVWRGSSWKTSTNRWRGGPDNEMATICVVRRIPFTAQSTARIDFFWPHHLCLRCRPRTWLEWTVKQSVRVTVSIERRRAHTNVPEKRDLIPIHRRPDNLGQEFLFKCLVIWLLALPGLQKFTRTSGRYIMYSIADALYNGCCCTCRQSSYYYVHNQRRKPSCQMWR